MRIEQQQWTATNAWTEPHSSALTSAHLVLLFGDAVQLKSQQFWQDLRLRYPQAYYLGCSTAGEIFDTQVLDAAIVATAVEFEHTQVRGAAIQLEPSESSFAAGDRLGRLFDPNGLNHVFVLSDGLQVNGSDLVRGLEQHLPAGVTLTGGLAGDGDRFQATYVIWNDNPAPNTIAAIGLYGDRLRVGYGSFGGWIPFGSERLITKSNGNILYELDGEPALALYKKYLGDHAAGLPATGLLFPLSLQVDVEDRWLVRTILSINEAEQSLTFAGDMPQGAIAQLMQASFDRLVDGAIQAAKISHGAIGGQSPDLAILISCVGRKLLLKQRIEEEIEGVREVLGKPTVLTGFYSYGEIAPFALGAPCELHNQTMTITTFRET